MAEKLKRDNATLAEAIKRLRSEAEEVARREGEAAEQVKSSVQVAEALRMEKTELEFEVRKTNKFIIIVTYVQCSVNINIVSFSEGKSCENNAVSK